MLAPASSARDQLAQGGRLDQRRIGKQHDDVAAMPLQRGPRCQHGVGRCRPGVACSNTSMPRRHALAPRPAPPPCRAPPPRRAGWRPPLRAWPARAPASSGRRCDAAPWRRRERMRTPLPAARTTIRSGGWSSACLRRIFDVSGGLRVAWPSPGPLLRPGAARAGCVRLQGIPRTPVASHWVLSATGSYGTSITCPQAGLAQTARVR